MSVQNRRINVQPHSCWFNTKSNEVRKFNEIKANHKNSEKLTQAKLKDLEIMRGVLEDIFKNPEFRCPTVKDIKEQNNLYKKHYGELKKSIFLAINYIQQNMNCGSLKSYFGTSVESYKNKLEIEVSKNLFDNIVNGTMVVSDNSQRSIKDVIEELCTHKHSIQDIDVFSFTGNSIGSRYTNSAKVLINLIEKVKIPHFIKITHPKPLRDSKERPIILYPKVRFANRAASQTDPIQNTDNFEKKNNSKHIWHGQDVRTTSLNKTSKRNNSFNLFGLHHYGKVQTRKLRKPPIKTSTLQSKKNNIPIPSQTAVIPEINEYSLLSNPSIHNHEAANSAPPVAPSLESFIDGEYPENIDVQDEQNNEVQEKILSESVILIQPSIEKTLIADSLPTVVSSTELILNNSSLTSKETRIPNQESSSPKVIKKQNNIPRIAKITDHPIEKLKNPFKKIKSPSKQGDSPKKLEYQPKPKRRKNKSLWGAMTATRKYV